MSYSCRFLYHVHLNMFWIKLFYYVSISLLGTLVLVLLKPSDPSYKPDFVDILFMSTSASTITGLTVVEMEVFSSSQIVILTVLMLLGGEVFTNLLTLLLTRFKQHRLEQKKDGLFPIELEANPITTSIESNNDISPELSLPSAEDPYHSSLRYLSNLILGYVIVIHVVFLLSFFIYLSVTTRAKEALKMKGINRLLFSLSLSISSFANGGMLPTSLSSFKKNTGLLLLAVPELLAGNTLFPVCIRLLLGVLRRFSSRAEIVYIMNSSKEIDFYQLVSAQEAAYLFFTVIGLIIVQIALSCSVDWNSQVFGGLSSYEKLVNSLFMAVNSRFAGEASLNVSLFSPAVQVLIIVMMYLPASASFVPIEEHDHSNKKERKRRKFLENFIFSQLSYIAMFIIVLCIIERKKMSRDPLNFSIFNAIFEVISAYGNVGFSTGYSCANQLHPDGNCKDKTYSLSGYWSSKGKLLVAFVMLFGRLKKFNMKGGKAWKLS